MYSDCSCFISDSPGENLWRFIIGCAMDMFGLPFLVACSISLYSKITRKETQGNLLIEPSHDKTYNKTCVTSKDQVVQPPRMARILINTSLDSLEAVEG